MLLLEQGDFGRKTSVHGSSPSSCAGGEVVAVLVGGDGWVSSLRCPWRTLSLFAASESLMKFGSYASPRAWLLLEAALHPKRFLQKILFLHDLAGANWVPLLCLTPVPWDLKRALVRQAQALRVLRTSGDLEPVLQHSCLREQLHFTAAPEAFFLQKAGICIPIPAQHQLVI